MRKPPHNKNNSHKCLKNRHGEDAEAAAASGCWVCPLCRGSCGPGCVICCNCSLCRKKAQLEPTAQIVHLARSAGFSNAHDYLVHLVTGETEAQIAGRKAAHDWGAFLAGEDAEPPAWLQEAAAARAAKAGGGGGGEGEEEQEEAPAAARKAGGKGRRASKGGAKAGGDATPAPASGGKAGKKAAAAAAPAAAAASGGKGRKRASSAAEAPAAADAATAAPAAASSAGEGAAANGKRAKTNEAAAAAAADEPASDVARAGGDQDAKLSRKARMMQRLGLAPRGEAVAA